MCAATAHKEVASKSEGMKRLNFVLSAPIAYLPAFLRAKPCLQTAGIRSTYNRIKNHKKDPKSNYEAFSING